MPLSLSPPSSSFRVVLDECGQSRVFLDPDEYQNGRTPKMSNLAPSVNKNNNMVVPEAPSVSNPPPQRMRGTSASSVVSSRSGGIVHRVPHRLRRRREPSERMIRKTLQRIGNAQKREQARRASRLAADRAWQSVCPSKTPTSKNGMGMLMAVEDLYSVSSNETPITSYSLLGSGSTTGAGGSVASTERALQRGSRRGARELNEASSAASSLRGGKNRRLGIPRLQQHLQYNNNTPSEVDLTTIAEDSILKEVQAPTGGPANVINNSNIWSKLWPPNHPKKAARSAVTTTATEMQAWMCGVCGLAFSSETVCERHETRHIRSVVEDLGLLQTTAAAAAAAAETSPKSQQSQSQQRQQPQTQLVHNNHSSRTSSSNPAVVAQHRDHPEFALEEIPILPTRSQETWRSTNAIASLNPPSLFFRQEEKHPDMDTSDGYPGLDADLPSGTLIPKPRPRSSSAEARLSLVHDPLLGPPQHGRDWTGCGHVSSRNILATTSNGSHHEHVHDDENNHILLLPNDMKDYVVVADEALLDVLLRAEPLFLSPSEVAAERELALLARDKAYYDELSQRAAARRCDPSNRFRSDDTSSWVGQVQNKLLDAYQLMKEGEGRHYNPYMSDQYTRRQRRRRDGGDDGTAGAPAPQVVHNDRTLYVNVMVKNSVQVVRHELQRLAEQRWEMTLQDENDDKNKNAAVAEEGKTVATARSLNRFERFRVYTQMHMVRLAGIALASDFTPRRIAVQLSNDTYRLMTPRLKRRGVSIETEIEYRVGPYFVLAVNINAIDWRKLIRATHRDVVLRKARWEKERQQQQEEMECRSFWRRHFDYCRSLYELTIFDAITYFFAVMYHFHWIVYLPVCWVAYNSFLGTNIRHFILSSVTDEIFLYVEQKGMEMEIRVCRAEKQAAFMLSALREIRADTEELKKKRQESESQEKGEVLGPLLGPAIAADKIPAIIPEGFEVPTNLEFIGLELDLPVGFHRLRWALLSRRSNFVTDALYRTEAKYENIVMGTWDKHAEHIGEPKLPEGVDPADFVGAQKEGEYLMPKSAFVSANMSYETSFILAYNDYCFCLKKKSKNPDAPFGKTFVAWTQYVVINTGNNTCRLTCSVEAEFPNGEPMVSRQIRSGMRAGTGDLFVLTGATITKYADEFP